MDCIIVDHDALAVSALQDYIDRTPFVQLNGVYADENLALEKVMSEKPEIVFLDILIPGFSGIEFLKNLAQKTQVIITTRGREYALDAFEYGVTDYLLKPVSYHRFYRAVNKARINQIHQEYKNGATGDSIFVKTDSRLVKINTGEIEMIEALSDYVNIFTDNKTFTVHSTMKGIESKLPPQDFIRIHRSYIVRFDRISEIENNVLTAGNKKLPIGGNYKEDLMNRLNLI